MQWGSFCRYGGLFFGNGLWLICGLEAEERKTISRNLEFTKSNKKQAKHERIHNTGYKEFKICATKKKNNIMM